MTAGKGRDDKEVGRDDSGGSGKLPTRSTARFLPAVETTEPLGQLYL